MVKTLPKQEPTAQWHISQLGYLTFLPQMLIEVRQRVRAPWRNTHRLVPMFSGYLFVTLDLPAEAAALNWPKIARQRGVQRVLCATRELPPLTGERKPAGLVHTPIPLRDGVVEALRELSRQATQAPKAVSMAIPVGSNVRVTEGPLAGLEGLCSWSNEQRVRLLMTLFAGDRYVEVPRQAAEIAV